MLISVIAAILIPTSSSAWVAKYRCPFGELIIHNNRTQFQGKKISAFISPSVLGPKYKKITMMDKSQNMQLDYSCLELSFRDSPAILE